MTAARVVETSVTVNSNSPIQDYVHPDDQTQPTFEMTPEFKPFTILLLLQVIPAKANYNYFTLHKASHIYTTKSRFEVVRYS